MFSIFMISTFGVLGILSRYGLDLAFEKTISIFPVSTLIINFFGSFLAGVVFTLGNRQVITGELQLALLVGFCGGFTTFSAFSVQTFSMLDRGQYLLGLSYFVLSPILGLLGASVGILLVRKLIL
jgi:CrcB protein